MVLSTSPIDGCLPLQLGAASWLNRSILNEFERQTAPTRSIDEEMKANYKLAVEKAIAHLPVKNGVINIDSIWIATSIPYGILNEVLRREDLALPDNVDRINLKSNVRERAAKKPNRRRRRRKKAKAKG